MSDNWRETLFIWDGIMKVEKAEKDGDPAVPLEWAGTWVGVDNADATKIEAPVRGAFDEQVKSEMTFSVEGTAIPIKDGDKEDGFKASLIKGAGWDLKDDGADTKSKHTDTVHELCLKQLRWLGSPDKTTNLVFARGENKFGPFISAGWMRPGNRITLARRYLDESDSRAKWDVDDLRKSVLDEISNENNVRTPPWQCSALHVDDQSGKRRKLEESADGEKANGNSGEDKAEASTE